MIPKQQSPGAHDVVPMRVVTPFARAVCHKPRYHAVYAPFLSAKPAAARLAEHTTMDFYPDLEGLPLFAKPAFGWEDPASAQSTETSPTKPRRLRQWRGPITHWERGYRSHYYRDKRGKKLGEIHLSPRGHAPLVYRWLAGTLSGLEGSLAHARMRVEEAIGFGMRQMALF